MILWTLFAQKWAFALLPVIPLLLLARHYFTRASAIRFSSTGMFRDMQMKFLKPRTVTAAFVAAAMALMIAALARPQKGESVMHVTSEGVEIMLVLDISGSMRAEDFVMNGRRENRLFIAKDVTERFINNRPDDRIGLVVFAGRAYTQCPLTLDHPVLLNLLDQVEIGQADDGTAIGSGLATAVNRLKASPAATKLIVLMTDGVNNAGKIDPMTAAGVAEKMGVKVYTVGVGTKGLAPYPVQDVFGNTVYQPVKIEIDDAMMERIAAKTGGQYFRATDTEGLKKIYDTIDKLEKSKIESLKYTHYEDLFRMFLAPALMLLLLGWLLGGTLFLEVP